MIIPPYLRTGDTIGIVAPARKISMEELQFAVKWLEEKGFRVAFAPNLFAEENQFAGSDDTRCQSFQAMLDDPEVKAILSARGGYGSARIIDKIDFSHFAEHPKWLCGYSDFTVFHSHLAAQNLAASLHSTMPISMSDDTLENCYSLLDALTGKKIALSGTNVPYNRCGNATGKVVGGNLSILYSLLGSPSDIDTDGAILFIEDLDEYLYHIDRMIVAYKRAGKLEHLAGLIVGGMSDMHDNTVPFGHTAEEIICEHCKGYNFPIAFQLPVGHSQENKTLKMGVLSELSVTSQGWTLKEL